MLQLSGTRWHNDDPATDQNEAGPTECFRRPGPGIGPLVELQGALQIADLRG
jgi:hypothetical protein